MDSQDLTGLLHRTFGFPAFRTNQEAVCRAATEGRDVLLVMPTGAGKSLCYQLPALARGGTALVVSPLIALMEDQATKLQTAGLRVARIHSGMDREQSRQASRDYLSGTLQFLFIAPERMRVPGFPEMLTRRKPSLIAIDEAHCISAWGHDFRPDYRTLGEHLPALRPAPVIALTATATPTVQQDIVAQLHLSNPSLFIHGFRRTNLAIEVVEMSKPRRNQFVADFLKPAAARPAIVYAPSRKSAEELAAMLGGCAAAYHAGLDHTTRERVQRQFLSGEIDIVVATIAFGMGIDKADVRTVLHTALPASVEAFYQEIGRAGRDGLPSRTVLLHSYADRMMHDFFLERDYPPADDLARVSRVLTDEFLMQEPLCRSLQMTPEVFAKAVEKLAGQGSVLIDNAGNVRRTGTVADTGRWRSSYDTQIAFRRAQIDHMVAFAETQQCRMTALIRHFGDTADAHRPCGICDFCAPGSTTAQTFAKPTIQQDRRLREILRALSTNSKSTGKLHTEVGIELPRREFYALLGSLTGAGLITVSNESFINDEGNVQHYKKASLTYEGREAASAGVTLHKTAEVSSTISHKRSRPPERGVAHKHTSRLRAADRSPEEQQEHRRAEKLRLSRQAELADAYTPEQAELHKQLRQWRNTEAVASKLRAFQVLTDATLIKVVQERPISMAELIDISGVGRAKSGRYGDAILRICRGSAFIPKDSLPSARNESNEARRSARRDPMPFLTTKDRDLQIQRFKEPTPTFTRHRAVPSEPAAALTPDQQQLDLRLREWRRLEAEKVGLPQFFVLGASTLRSIVLLRPQNLAHLKTIGGIGPEKIEKFGAGILQVCNPEACNA